jgi:hypothetical protein
MRNAHFFTQCVQFACFVQISKVLNRTVLIANQKAHHAKRSFQDEYRELLRQNRIDFDESYVWD